MLVHLVHLCQMLAWSRRIIVRITKLQKIALVLLLWVSVFENLGNNKRSWN